MIQYETCPGCGRSGPGANDASVCYACAVAGRRPRPFVNVLVVLGIVTLFIAAVMTGLLVLKIIRYDLSTHSSIPVLERTTP